MVEVATHESVATTEVRTRLPTFPRVRMTHKLTPCFLKQTMMIKTVAIDAAALAVGSTSLLLMCASADSSLASRRTPCGRGTRKSKALPA